jgi:hypothetical protein
VHNCTAGKGRACHAAGVGVRKLTGTSRACVNSFLNRFKKLGFIDDAGGNALTINNALLNVVLHD